MKRHPSQIQPGRPTRKAPRLPVRQEYRPQDDAQAVQPFLVSGGMTAFPLFNQVAPPANFNPTNYGVQLLCSVFVPRGSVGWIKQLRVAPYCPPELANPWQGWDANWQDFQQPVPQGFGVNRAPAQAGVYTTPMGWESYIDALTDIPPQWTWWITYLQGTIEAARAHNNVGPFDPFNPSTWFLVESMPIPQGVPGAPYTLSVPGRSPSGGNMNPQRMQVTQEAAVNLHLMIPENSTALLWARWLQSDVATYTRDLNGASIVGPRIPPLLPSFGQMAGYMQSVSGEGAQGNSRHGWGG